MPLKDVRGQERAVDILKSSVAQNRVAHAYLFLGPEGVGKLKTALEFSKFLNCRDNQEDCCGSCPSCIKIEKQIHPDIFVITKEESKAQLSIKKIRQLQRRLSLKAFEAEYKVAIIADAEDMTEEAANSLLKMLEEPGADTVFILIASSEKRLADTIVSRCQIIRFRPLTKDEVTEILTKDFSIDKDEAKFLSTVSNANVEKALFLKERDAIVWKNDIIDRFLLSDALLKKDRSSIMTDKREQQLEAMDVLLGFYRDLLIFKITSESSLVINIDRIDKITDMAVHLDIDKIEAFIREIAKTRRLLESNVNSKLAITALGERIRA